MHPHPRRSVRAPCSIAALAVGRDRRLGRQRARRAPDLASRVARRLGARRQRRRPGRAVLLQRRRRAGRAPTSPGIRLRNAVELWGTGADLQSVGFRPLIQHLVGGVWTTVKKGTLVTRQRQRRVVRGPAPAGLHRVARRHAQPENPFRLVLKLIWYTADASVQGTRMVARGQLRPPGRRRGQPAARGSSRTSDAAGADRRQRDATPGPSPRRGRARSIPGVRSAWRAPSRRPRSCPPGRRRSCAGPAPAGSPAGPRRTAPPPAPRAAGTRSRPRRSPG